MKKFIPRKVKPFRPEEASAVLCKDLQPVMLEHKNPWFSIMSRGGYYTLEYERPQVVVVPQVDDEYILMIRVRRPVIGDCPLEFPAGDSLTGESPRSAAAREFEEESGIKINDHTRFKPELPISEMSGRIPVLLNVFSVQISMEEYAARQPHDNEVHSVELVSISKSIQQIVSGEIYVSATCALLSRLILAQNLKGKQGK